MPHRHDLLVLEQAVLQDLFGAQLVAAVKQGHLAGEVGQEQRLFHGGIAAADHHDLLAAVEEAVAGGASRDAEALVGLLGLETQPLGARAGGKDHRIGGVGRAAVAMRHKGPHVEVELGDNVPDDLGAHGAGMGLHVDHQLGALHLGMAGPVLDLGGGGQLATRLEPLHEDRFEHGTRGVDAGGVAGRAGADDQDLGVAGIGHGAILGQSVSRSYSRLAAAAKAPPRSACRFRRSAA